MTDEFRDQAGAEAPRRRYAISQEPEVVEDAVLNTFDSYRDEVQVLIPENVPLLAAILMEQGLLDQGGLNRVLERQSQTGASLAAVLFELEIVGADQLITALQYRSSYR